MYFYLHIPISEYVIIQYKGTRNFMETAKLKILLLCILFVGISAAAGQVNQQPYIDVTIANTSPFIFDNMRAYFKHGKFFNANTSSLIGTLGKWQHPNFMVASGWMTSAGVEGVIVYECNGDNLVIYFMNPFYGDNRYGAWILTGNKTADDRYDDVVNLRHRPDISYTNYSQTFIVKSKGTSGQDYSYMTVEIRAITQSCLEPIEKLMRAYNCGDAGKCWMWCNNQTSIAGNSTESDGKWCYTSDTNACTAYGNCAAYSSCVNSTCNANC